MKRGEQKEILLKIIQEHPNETGFQIHQRFTEQTGKFLNFGTLYVLLLGMESQGVLKSVWDPPAPLPDNSLRRRTYEAA